MKRLKCKKHVNTNAASLVIIVERSVSIDDKRNVRVFAGFVNARNAPKGVPTTSVISGPCNRQVCRWLNLQHNRGSSPKGNGKGRKAS